MKPDLIIFDCDGVLVDSEVLSNTVFCNIVNELGVKLSFDESFRIFTGRSDNDCHMIVSDMLGRPAPANLMEIYAERVAGAFEKELKPVRNVKSLIEKLGGVRMCVASNAPPEKTERSLKLTGLIRHFEGRIYSADMVEKPKPHPDLFLYAARQMNAAPSRSIVIEDSIYGARAGIAAGMKVFGYAERSDAAALRGEGAIPFFDMLELYDKIQNLKSSIN